MAREKILIVEDDVTEAMVIESRLQMQGYTIAGVASTGEAAMEAAAQSPPDLILMDIMLPGKLDGIETAIRLKALRDMPVVFLTAYADDSTLERVKEAEPYGFLVKPFEAAELRSTIEIALYKHSLDQALQKKERSLAKAQRLAQTGNWDWNIITNELWWSDEIYRIFGLRPRRFGATYDAFLEAVHPADRARVREAVDRALRDLSSYRIDHRIVRPDGEIRMVHEEGELLLDKAGRPLSMHGTVQDITERERTEIALRQSYDSQLAISELLKFSLAEKALTEILERALDVILDISWLTLKSRGCIYLPDREGTGLIMTVRKNMEPGRLDQCARVPAGSCLCGLAASTHKIVFASGLDDRHLPIDDLELPHGHYCVPVLHGERLLAVINLYLNEGHERSLREEEFLTVFAGVLAGIMHNKLSEDEKARLNRELQDTFISVARSQKEWQETFDSITDMISIHDNKHTIVKANKAFARHFGLDPRDVVHKKCYELFHAQNGPAPNCPHARTVAHNKAVSEEVIDGKTRTILQVTTYPFTFLDTGESGSIHIARDITEERRKEVQFNMNERMAALGRMASGVAHEINNPLASMAGCVESLMGRVRKGNYDTSLFEQYLGIIQEEIVRCKGITMSMLSMVRKESFDREAMDISDVIEKSLAPFAVQGRLSGIEIEKSFVSPLPEVYGSASELEQVFRAVISNALDAMEDRGRLRIGTALVGGLVQVTIADNGPGISHEQSQKIFDPFYTTKIHKGGTGLSLSIIRKILQNHEGSIEVASEEGTGAAFSITFPPLGNKPERA